MAVRLAAVEFSPLKTCFISLPITWTQEFHKKQLSVYELQWGDGGRAYVSWAGDAVMLPSNVNSSPSIHINGLYGNKLGLCNGQERQQCISYPLITCKHIKQARYKLFEQVLLQPLIKVVSCTRVCVEPATTDDWEILELNTEYVELNLLNQIRIVWTGQVLPVWIEKICIFVRIGVTDPPAPFVQLEQNTELIVNPKSRTTFGSSKTTTSTHPSQSRTTLPNPSRQIGNKSNSSSMGSLASSALSSAATSPSDPFLFSSHSPDDRHKTTTERKPWEVENEALERSIPWSYRVWHMLKSMVTSGSSEYDSVAGVKDSEEARLKMAAEFWKDVRIIARVQSMFEHQKSSDSTASSVSVNEETESSRQPKFETGNNGTLTGPDESPNSKSVATDTSTSPMNSYTHLMQPTTVYLSSNCETEFMLHHNSNGDDHQCPVNKFLTFLAYLSKLPSPKEKRDEINRKFQQTQSKYEKVMRDVIESKLNSKQSQSTKDVLATSENAFSSCVVRVIINSNELNHGCQTENLYSSNTFHDRDISWFVQIPDLLRRQLGLESSAKVVLCPVLVPPAPIQSIAIYPLFDKPASLKSEDLVFAFEYWLSCVSCMISPIPVQQHGTLLRFPISRTGDTHGEFLISVNYQQKAQPNACDTSQPYYLLHPLIAKRSRAAIMDKITSINKPNFIHRMPFGEVSELDNPLRGYRLRDLGGVTDVGKQAMDYLATALILRPLSQCLGDKLPGLLQGGLLICGPRGSGKSTLSRSVCREMTQWPSHVHVRIVECKSLKGKRIETIRKIWEEAVNEAAWRQPSIVLLDDLDHVTACPLGPEQEIGAEAVYHTRLADALKDIMMAEVKEGSRICVLVTARSKSTLHQSVTSCKGCNLFQLCLEIPSLSKPQCVEVLNSAIHSKVEINLQTLNQMNIDALAACMEGYVARDIVTVVERAIHAGCNRQLHQATDTNTHGNSDEILLMHEDFEVALENYIPATLRDVPLHSAGELGWGDVGGLEDVRRVLQETLQLPAKYPSLFANCPLRLRSGLLLYGPPGTGKTLLGGVVAKECGLNFISIKGPELLSKYIGASEQAVRDIFSRAQSAKPCILFFDEFDSLAPRRGHDSTGVTDRVVNQLLTQLDGVEGLQGVYIIGATSRPDLIDPALLRPGRLDKCLFCPIPTTEERVEILQALSRKLPLTDDVDLRSIAITCDYFTGADFKALLYNAQLEAIHNTLSISDDFDPPFTPLSTKQRSMGANEWKLTFLDSFSAENDGLTVDDMEKDSVENKEVPEPMEDLDNSYLTDLRGSADQQVIFMPTLRDGVVEPSRDTQEKINSQVSVIKDNYRQRRNRHQGYLDSERKPVDGSKAICISQANLVRAAVDMKPSVSFSERARYQSIYDKFVQSRGGNFNTVPQQMEQQRATLA